ncbi:cysteine-rich domain protein [Moorella sp. E308F]|jgi:Fe-S oxidoreductase|uniref:(Fe-S)-binding protein n=1 Tax=Moorella sp. E308F TaxID=2572682 RepID=UPI0010FFC707|nr:(Fe-S)-binding protein [Moorella sp. E308F]GEA15192.1 cysteine-rich domain protein [Moorella sp. E308F]
MALELKAESRDYRLPQTLEVIRGNIVKYGNPLGLKGNEVAGWARDLNLPRQGDVLLYTGGEYQLVPYIDSLVDMLTRMNQGSVGFSLMMGVRNLIDRVGINPEKIVAGVRSRDRERYRDVSRKAALILQEMGLKKICYLGEEEIYSGALLYEYGFVGDLRQHARKVAELINSTGARAIICLSPHSAEIFKLIYPELLENFNYEVKTFLEAVYDLVKDAPGRLPTGFSGNVTVHDSCRMARELGITEEIRDILGKMEGVNLIEPELNRRWTTCCGGPGKVLFPELSGKIAARRVGELAATNADLVITFCPYCLAALDKGRREGHKNIQLEDFIEFLYRGIAK